MTDRYKKFTDLVYFDDNHEGEMIQSMARGMSMDEICDYFGAPKPESLPPEDLEYLRFNYRKGRASGRKEAVERLFQGMANTKTGASTCLSYLIRFSDDWEEISSDSDLAKNKSFKITME